MVNEKVMHLVTIEKLKNENERLRKENLKLKVMVKRILEKMDFVVNTFN